MVGVGGCYPWTDLPDLYGGREGIGGKGSGEGLRNCLLAPLCLLNTLRDSAVTGTDRHTDLALSFVVPVSPSVPTHSR